MRPSSEYTLLVLAQGDDPGVMERDIISLAPIL